jgi:hypothetical protein
MLENLCFNCLVSLLLSSRSFSWPKKLLNVTF